LMEILKIFLNIKNNMKKIIIIAILSLTILQGCTLFDKGKELGDDLTNSYNNVLNEADKVGESVTNKQKQAKEAIDTLNKTIDQAEETKKALEEIL